MENTEKKNPLSDLIQTTLENIRTLADANTIVGAPIQAARSSLQRSSRRAGTMDSAAAAAPGPSWSRWLFWSYGMGA